MTKKAIFNYPKEFVTLPEYSAHRGQVVTVLNKLSSQEADAGECEPMYVIEAADGWKGEAFESELQ